MHFLHIIGARPNFMKVAPVYRALTRCPGVRQTLVHTGQHYDYSMSDVFIQQLEIPAPEINLAVGSGSHAVQTANIIRRLEPVVLEYKPDFVLVYGDVNSTIAAALVCSKLHVRVAHVEAGLRAFDRTMPEEINRVLTDQIADLLFTPSSDGDENLLREGVPREKVYLVGNVMIDTLVRFLPKAIEVPPIAFGLPYVLLTLHRPSNVDDTVTLRELLDAILDVTQGVQVIFPVHPRTRQKLEDIGVNGSYAEKLKLLEPAPYIQFLAWQRGASVVMTDSGGIQEETTFLGVPCLTLRENTERPITVSCGTNTLVGRNFERLQHELRRIASGNGKRGSVPPFWDGHAGKRIAEILIRQPDLVHERRVP